MKTIYLQILLVIGLCSVMSCSSGKSGQTTGENEKTFKSTRYANFISSNVIALQDSLLFLYNMEEDEMIPFHLDEPDEIFNFTFGPEGEQTLYYTVVRDGILWLRKATFSDEGAKIEDLINMNIPKEKCVTESYGNKSTLKYKDGMLLMKSDFSWEVYAFSTINVYSIADGTLSIAEDHTVFEDAPSLIENQFKTEGGQLFYLNNGQEYSLTDKLGLKLDDYEYSAIDQIEYMDISLSPDGSKVAFVAITSFGDLPHGPLCIADSDGTNQQILKDDGAAYSKGFKWIGNSLFFIDEDEELIPENDSDCTTSLFSTRPEMGNTGYSIFKSIRYFDIKPSAKTQ